MVACVFGNETHSALVRFHPNNRHSLTEKLHPLWRHVWTYMDPARLQQVG